jgi:8-oxo-dGTP pyrophosphatase MutT (NUDIX family)
MLRHPFYEFLTRRLNQPLPGEKAQKKLQPIPQDEGFHFPDEGQTDPHPSGVCILLFEDDEDQLRVVLTLRTETIRHAGQISFPGGRSGDGESLKETALRETHEEVGISPDQISIAGPITPLFLYKSNNRITPFVGFLNEPPSLKPSPDEVQEAFTVRLADLLNDDFLDWKTWELPTATFRVPYWKVHATPLWGATAMMMSEFLELYREFLNRQNA